MSIARKILSNTFIQVAGKIITALLALITIKYITSLESIPGLSGIPAEYKLIYTYLTFFGILADFGLFTIAVREMSREDESRTPYILGNIFGMRIVTILFAMILASCAVFLIPAENYTLQVKLGVAFAAITTVFTMLASTASSVLQVKLKMWFPTIAIIIGKLIMVGYILYTITNYKTTPYAFYHLLGAGIIGALVTFILTYYYTYKVAPFKPQFDFKYWKKIFWEAAPYGVAIILSTIYFKVDVILLSFLRDKSEIAIYGFPSTMIEMMAIFPIYFMNSVLPSLTRSINNNIEHAKKIIQHSANFIWLIAAPLTMGGFVLATPIIKFIMNDAFLSSNITGGYGADLAFKVIILSFLFSFLTVLWSFTLVAHNEQKKLLKINSIGVLFNVITNLIFIPKYGFFAAAITTIISEALMMLLTYLHCRKFISIKIDKLIFTKITIAAFIMGYAIYLINPHSHIAITVTLGALIFGALLFPLKIVDKKMLSLLISKNGFQEN